MNSEGAAGRAAAPRLRVWLLAVGVIGLASCGPADAGQADGTTPPAAAEAALAGVDQAAAGAAAVLDAVRAATERFRDVNVALAEGYQRDPMDICDTAEMMGFPAGYGVMGIHFVRPDLLGITGPPDPRVNGTGTHTDFERPAVLIYEPQQDGSLDPVAVENLVFIAAWEAAGNRERPSFAGVPFELMRDDPATDIYEAHMFEPHYDLHVWLYRDNPRGTFAQFNPNATCQYHQPAAPHAH